MLSTPVWVMTLENVSMTVDGITRLLEIGLSKKRHTQLCFIVSAAVNDKEDKQ